MEKGFGITIEDIKDWLKRRTDFNPKEACSRRKKINIVDAATTFDRDMGDEFYERMERPSVVSLHDTTKLMTSDELNKEVDEIINI